MARRDEEQFAVGEDAFMDTIANLVGIMIILVVIVSAKGYTAAKTLAREEVREKIDDLAVPSVQAENLERDLAAQIEQLHRYEVETAYRNAERMTLVDRKTHLEQEMHKRLEELDSETQRGFEQDAQAAELEKQLGELERQQGFG